MMRRLLGLKTAATARAPRARLALIACVACCLHVRAARAEERPQPDGEVILPVTALTVSAEAPLEYDAPFVDLSFAGDDATTSIDSADGDRFGSPRYAAVTSAPRRLVSATTARTAWIPQGMIPYIGPRTPDSQKDRGMGWPLEGRGWRNNPFSISGFSGATAGGPFVPGHVHQQPSYYGGFNIGWDYDHYWGIEKRLGVGALSLTDGDQHAIHGRNFSITGEYRLMYYPLGDARWRPFLTSGVGWSDFYFNDDQGDKHLDTVGMVPFGLGIKYLHNQNLAARVDLIDELTFGGGSLSTFHYVALTAGLEVRYGHRLLKMPWHRADSDDN
jgi:hypothetical protein